MLRVLDYNLHPKYFDFLHDLHGNSSQMGAVFWLKRYVNKIIVAVVLEENLSNRNLLKIRCQINKFTLCALHSIFQLTFGDLQIQVTAS